MATPAAAQPAAGKIPLIYNPASGGGKGNLRFRETQSLLASAGIEIEPHRTMGAGHATELGLELADAGHPKIFVLGGDGTLSEASNGVLRSKHKPVMGFIPSGTGNDFLRDFEITRRTQAIDRIRLGRPRKIDALHIRADDVDRFSINIFGIGFAAHAAAAANKFYKWAGGQAYNFGILHHLVQLTPTPTKLTMDGVSLEGNFPMVMACNSIHTGGAMKMAPMAQADDGVVDVLYVDPVSRRELLALLAGIREGRHVRHDKVHFQRAKKIRIEPETPSPLLADGEVYGITPVDLTVRAGALQVLL